MKLYNDDVYLIFDKLSKDKLVVNAIITDPPYNISQKNNFHTLGNRQGIDFGEWDNGEFDMCKWVYMYSSLLDKNGCMVIFCSYRAISDIINILEEKAGMVVKDILLWEKSNPMPRNVHRRYVGGIEFAIYAVKKGGKWTFNKPADKPYLRPIFKYPISSGKERLGHPTQKSLKLMEDIISIHTNKGDIVLDPFMGSGTTGDACIQLGRKFIGIEKDNNYFQIASDRLNKYI